jgi:hypothetical protein
LRDRPHTDTSYTITEIAIDAAAQQPIEESPPTITALRDSARTKAFADWTQEWLDSPHRSPVYRALHQPPSSQPPDFMIGVGKAARPVFCTTIRLLTEHAFTGEYSARHRPKAPEPHGCTCGHHIVIQCPQYRAAREAHLLTPSPTLSIDIIFGTKSGREGLAKFIEATQACVRPRIPTPPPEDHG